MADVHRPDTDSRVPALIAASAFPRQIQDSALRWASSMQASPTSGCRAGRSDFDWHEARCTEPGGEFCYEERKHPGSS
jgi:hypothetical protein